MKEGKKGQERRETVERTNDKTRRGAEPERKIITDIIDKRKTLNMADDNEDYLDYNIEDDIDEILDEIEEDYDSNMSDMYRRLMKNTLKISSQPLNGLNR